MSEKQQQIDKLHELINSLEGGYLRDILTDAAGMIEGAIRNDFVVIDLRARHDETRRLAEEIKQLQQKRDELADLMRTAAKAARRMADLLPDGKQIDDTIRRLNNAANEAIQ